MIKTHNDYSNSFDCSSCTNYAQQSFIYLQKKLFRENYKELISEKNEKK